MKKKGIPEILGHSKQPSRHCSNYIGILLKILLLKWPIWMSSSSVKMEIFCPQPNIKLTFPQIFFKISWEMRNRYFQKQLPNRLYEFSKK